MKFLLFAFLYLIMFFVVTAAASYIFNASINEARDFVLLGVIAGLVWDKIK